MVELIDMIEKAADYQIKLKLKYSPDASDKLKELKKQISASYGSEDFLWRMFRVRLRTQESRDFWGE